MPVCTYRSGRLALALLTLSLSAGSLEAQSVLDKLKKQTEEIKSTIDGAREVHKDGTGLVGSAKSLGCSARGTTCAKVTSSADFKPRRYSILAVALTAKGSAYGRVNFDQLVRDAFESAIVRKGFSAAPGTDVKRIQQRINQAPENSEARQAQLKDFAESIDGVLLVEGGNPAVTRCERTEGKRKVYGQELTVTMSVRWLNTDTPDIPWMATHRVSSCDTRNNAALEDALSQLAIELANAIPERLPKPTGK